MPEPETDEIGRYLEDTITIDWQTPSVMAKARELLEGLAEPEARIERLFCFVRDEIADSEDTPTEEQTCRSSEVLEKGTGLDYAKSHLLAGLLRYSGFPTGFCYVRLADGARPDRFALYGFNAVYWAPERRWLFLDARGGLSEHTSVFRLEPPWSLSRMPDAERGEGFLPFIYKRPAKRILDLLERAPNLATVLRNRPDAI